MCEARIKLRIHAHNLEKDKMFGAHTGHLAKSAVWFLEVVNDAHAAGISNLEQGQYAGQLMPPLDHDKEPMGIQFEHADESYFGSSELEFFELLDQGKNPPTPISQSLTPLLRAPTEEQKQQEAGELRTQQMIEMRRQEQERLVARQPSQVDQTAQSANNEVHEASLEDKEDDEFGYMDSALLSVELDAVVDQVVEQAVATSQVASGPNDVEQRKRELGYDPGEFIPMRGTDESYKKACAIVESRGGGKKPKKSYDSHGNEHYNRKKYNPCSIPPSAVGLQMPLGSDQKQTVARILVQIQNTVGDGAQRTDKQVSRLLIDRWNVEHYVELLDYKFGYGGVMSAEVGLRIIRDMVKQALKGQNKMGFNWIILTPSQLRGPGLEDTSDTAGDVGDNQKKKKKGRKKRTPEPLLPIANVKMNQVLSEDWSSDRIYQHLKKFREVGIWFGAGRSKPARRDCLKKAIQQLEHMTSHFAMAAVRQQANLSIVSNASATTHLTTVRHDATEAAVAGKTEGEAALKHSADDITFADL